MTLEVICYEMKIYVFIMLELSYCYRYQFINECVRKNFNKRQTNMSSFWWDVEELTFLIKKIITSVVERINFFTGSELRLLGAVFKCF